LNCYKIRELFLKYSAEFYLFFSLRACFIFWGRRRRRFSLQNQRRCSLISYLSLPLRQKKTLETRKKTQKRSNNWCECTSCAARVQQSLLKGQNLKEEKIQKSSPLTCASQSSLMIRDYYTDSHYTSVSTTSWFVRKNNESDCVNCLDGNLCW